MSTDNINRITAFAAILSTSTALTATRDTSNSNSHRIFSFLSWSGLSHREDANFHRLTQDIWIAILAKKTAANRERLIEQSLADPLRRQYPELSDPLTPDWIKGTAKFEIAQAPNK